MGNMATIKPSIKDVLFLEKIPTVLEAFVMGHYLYKETWMLFVGEKLDTANNVKNNFSRRKEEGHWSSSPRKVWKVCKGYFLLSKNS